MDEFAMGSSTENSAFSPRTIRGISIAFPGGSSGGSAAAVAADEALRHPGFGHGRIDRQPRPVRMRGRQTHYGRVSRYGLVAFASSLDQIGPFAKTVRDAATVLHVISGHDPRDSTSVPQPVPDYAAGLDQGIRGLKLGAAREYMIGGLDPDVKAPWTPPVKQFKGSAPRSSRFPCRTPTTASRFTTLSRRPRRQPTSRAFDGIRYGSACRARIRSSSTPGRAGRLRH
jgi:aspartyl-tRNA(Asn)/glutamyl-tRNA(Gln) amidotransferase subunit A